MSTPLRDEEHGHPIARPQATPEPEGTGEADPYEGHTPGPWCVEDAMSAYPLDIALEYRLPGRESPIIIASVYLDDEDDDVPSAEVKQAKATARLIADAPKLLRENRQQAAEIAALRAQLAAVERERDGLIMAWPTATDADVWEEETPDAVARQRDGKWCVMSRDLGVFATREAAVRAAAGLAGAGEEGRTP